jgi:hypothetical protein
MAHGMNAGIGPIIKFAHIPIFFRFGKVRVIKHLFSFVFDASSENDQSELSSAVNREFLI